MSQITTHILDTSKGSPASGINVILFQQENNAWKEIGNGTTNTDGRVSDLLNSDIKLPSGNYKLKFDTKKYFDISATASFYPFVEIVFEIKSDAHYHVPLLLNPFGYSTYRGS